MARELSAQTLFVRNLLEKNPDLTFSQAHEQIKSGGFNLDGVGFANIKAQWKKLNAGTNGSTHGGAKRGRKPGQKNAQTQQTQATGSLSEAVQFVTEQGGFEKACASVARHQELIDLFRAQVLPLVSQS